MRLPLAVRLAGARLLGRIPVRIRGGPLQGHRWTLASSGRGYVTGHFEAARIRWLLSVLRPTDCFWDLGAHKGYVSLAAATRLDAGAVYAFEPSRMNLLFLRQHLRWNGADRITVMPLAVSDTDGSARFGGRGSTLTHRLGRGDEEVAVRSIRSLLERDGLRPPSVLKIDVEGEEARVLAGAGASIPEDALLLIAIHTLEQYESCRSWLAAHGFRAIDSGRIRRARQAHPGEWRPDPDLLGVGPARALDDAALREFTN